MTVIDMAWLERLAELAEAKVEVDRDGGVAVSPASDRHVVAATRLVVQIAGQVDDDGEVVVEGPRWSPLGSLAPSDVPDVAVLWRSSLARPADDYRLAPPPVLVVEILSPATRRRDLGEKEVDYYLGGASMYWTIEIPGLADVAMPQARVRRRGLDGWDVEGAARTGLVRVSAGRPFDTDLTVDLDRLV